MGPMGIVMRKQRGRDALLVPFTALATVYIAQNIYFSYLHIVLKVPIRQAPAERSISAKISLFFLSWRVVNGDNVGRQTQ